MRDLIWRLIGTRDVNRVHAVACALGIYTSSHGRLRSMGPSIKGGRRVENGGK